MNGQLFLGEPVGDRQRRVAGEVHFVPPVRRGERARRRAWVDANDIDPPPHRGPGEPCRLLADSEQWRLGILGWRERLVLAGALSTRLPVTAVVCGPAMLPRVGFVVQKVALLRRTLVHVPWEALPDDLQASLLATRTVHALGEHLLECGEELP